RVRDEVAAVDGPVRLPAVDDGARLGDPVARADAIVPAGDVRGDLAERPGAGDARLVLGRLEGGQDVVQHEGVELDQLLRARPRAVPREARDGAAHHGAAELDAAVVPE